MGQVEKRQDLERVIASATDKPHVILLWGHPDPDAIGSAIAHKRLCERMGASATIAHVLPVSRAENHALVKLLNVPMLRISEGSELEQFGYLSLVDASASEATIRLPEGLKLLTVVDHHRGPREIDAPFVDVRRELGATSTIYVEYIEGGLAPFSQAGRDDIRVATAMLFGIQTDTDAFALATPGFFLPSLPFRPLAFLGAGPGASGDGPARLVCRGWANP